MKNVHKILFLIIGIVFWATMNNAESIEYPFDGAKPLFSLSATTTWKDFTITESQAPLILKNAAWIGLITLKSTTPFKLEELLLQWRGQKISTLHAALYQKKETDKILIPIEENLICDGTWDTKKQQLIFPVNKKIVAVNKYYLLLNYPTHDAAKIKHGKFVVPHKNFCKIKKL